MAFELPKLNFAANALAPHMSEETLEFHHGKHHATYVSNANKLIEGTDLANKSLEEVIKIAAKDDSLVGLFNNAAQIYNHNIFWQSLTPNSSQMPTKLKDAVVENFGSVDKFMEDFANAAVTQFGSGWAWLVQNENDGKLQIVKTSNAQTPLVQDVKVLFTVDVWEHAYYIDYRNRRPDFVKTVLNELANWEFAQSNML